MQAKNTEKEKNNENSMREALNKFDKAIRLKTLGYGPSNLEFVRGQIGSKEEVQYCAILPIMVIVSATDELDNTYELIHQNSPENIIALIEIAVANAKKYCQDPQHENIFKLSNSKLRWYLFTLSEVIINFICVLNTYNFLEEALDLSITFKMLLEKLGREMDVLARQEIQIHSKFVEQITLSLWRVLREIVYSHALRNDLTSAENSSKEVFRFAQIISPTINQNLERDHKLVEYAITSSLYLKSNKINLAEECLNKAFNIICNLKHPTNKAYMEILAANCRKVATHYFISQQFLKSMKYYEYENKILSNIIPQKFNLRLKKNSDNEPRILTSDSDPAQRIAEALQKINWIKNKLNNKSFAGSIDEAISSENDQDQSHSDAIVTNNSHHSYFYGKTLYPLWSSPDRPNNFFYGYVDASKLSFLIDTKTLDKLKDVLSRGRITLPHRGRVNLTEYTSLNHVYSFKIRLLSESKEDIFIYGRIFKYVIKHDAPIKKYIIFDHAEGQLLNDTLDESHSTRLSM